MTLLVEGLAKTTSFTLYEAYLTTYQVHTKKNIVQLKHFITTKYHEKGHEKANEVDTN
jgi:hypothetical protein